MCTLNCHCDTQWRVGVTAERKTFMIVGSTVLLVNSGYMADPSLQGMFD